METQHIDDAVAALEGSARRQNVTHAWALLRRYSAGAVSERLESIPVHVKTLAEKYEQLVQQRNEMAHYMTFGGVKNVEALAAGYTELGVPTAADGRPADEMIEDIQRELASAQYKYHEYQRKWNEWQHYAFEDWNMRRDLALQHGHPAPPLPTCALPPHDPEEWDRKVESAIQAYASTCSGTYAFKLWEMIERLVDPEELNSILEHDPEYLETHYVIHRTTTSEQRVAVPKVLPWTERVNVALDEEQGDILRETEYNQELARRIAERRLELLSEKRFRLIRERLIRPDAAMYDLNDISGRQALGRLALLHAFRNHPMGNLNHWLMGTAMVANSSKFVLVFNSRVVENQMLTPFSACILYILQSYEGFWDTWSSLWRQCKPQGLHVAETAPHWTRDAPRRIQLYREVMKPCTGPIYDWAQSMGIAHDIVTEAALVAFDFMNHQEGRLALGLRVRDRQGEVHCTKKWVRRQFEVRMNEWKREMEYRLNVLRELIPTAIEPVLTDIYNPEWASVDTLYAHGRLKCPVHE